MTFQSILFGNRPAGDEAAPAEPDFFRDLNLDRIVRDLSMGRDEYDLTPFFRMPVRNAGLIAYRQVVMKDVEREAVSMALESFASGMREARRQLAQADELRYPLQQQRWLLDGADTYCRAVVELASALAAASPSSQGLCAFLEFLNEYTASGEFVREREEIDALREELDAVHYNILIKDGALEVRRHDGEPDYSAEVERVFRKFREADAEGFAIQFKESVRMNHVEAKILEFVAHLYPDVFRHLAAFCESYGDRMDETVVRFDREIQFYLAYLEHMAPHRRNGLRFCYPGMQEEKRGVQATETFDLALADSLLAEKGEVITNDFRLEGRERVIVVSGPNQGGKSTFLRSLGQCQLHGPGGPLRARQGRHGEPAGPAVHPLQARGGRQHAQRARPLRTADEHRAVTGGDRLAAVDRR